MKKRKRLFDVVFQAPKPRIVRVLGRAPRFRNVRMKIHDSFDLFVETFGPPEQIRLAFGRVLFWNFTTPDGNEVSLLAGLRKGEKLRGRREIQVGLAARRGAKSFTTWTLDRLSKTDNCDEPPLFLSRGSFAIGRL